MLFAGPDRAGQWWRPLTECRPQLGLELPPAGAPLRVAFVGQRTYFESCSQVEPTPALDPCFVDYREGDDAGALGDQLRSLEVDVVVVFRPEVVPSGVLDQLDALTVGYLTEPLPLGGPGEHPDLQRRLHALAKLDPAQFDRIVSFDPGVIDTARRFTHVWRGCPLPVDDRVFAWQEMPVHPRAAFIGRSTAHREAFLVQAKHEHDLLHVEHGVHGAELLDLLHMRCDVAVNLHNENYPTFENRVAVHLAAGHLLISEPLRPSHSLEPGSDYLEITSPEELSELLARIELQPSAYELTRVRGRQKAEQFRASRVWARLILDLLRDVAAFGRRPARP